MEIIHVALDRKLLNATNQAARRTKQNRSALIRNALREHLRVLENRQFEQLDREGYLKHQADHECAAWEAQGVWPSEE